ncbi:hypothetical protein Glove_194g69 [Diversispora epigaea]|uniref:Uncharacterized protein n=1 Tax=Diversispora epigaea TaxID=1348612 RepID=A0A397ILC3_9GLOM|nr:hypothetical protein Glove_194g69 [Diversispora epigaea]
MVLLSLAKKKLSSRYAHCTGWGSGNYACCSHPCASHMMMKLCTALVISVSGSWIELFQFNINVVKIGIFIGFSLLEVTEVFADNLQQLLQMFAAILKMALGKVAEFIETEYKEEMIIN